MLTLPSALALLFAFVLMVRYREKVAASIRRTKIPSFVLYFLTSAILIVFEEQVNCGIDWCGKVLIPPTLPFLLVESLIIYTIIKLIRIKSVWTPSIVYALFGILWEVFVGAARLQLQQLFVQNHLIYFFLLAWVGMSYIFVLILPLTILQENPS